jgi:hypothetical protein
MRRERAFTCRLKSVELDEQYSKGWARLAAAQQESTTGRSIIGVLITDCRQEMDNYTSSVASFQKALDTLPAKGLSAAQLQQKKQYEEAHKKVKAIVAEREKRAAQLSQPAGGMPWEAALRMRPQLQRAGEKGRNSIAWSIIAAHKVSTLVFSLSLTAGWTWNAGVQRGSPSAGDAEGFAF